MLGNSQRTKRATHVVCMAEKTNVCRVLMVRFTCNRISKLVGSRACSILYCNRIYDHLPEDEPSVSKHVKGINKLKIKILILKDAILWSILYIYITMHGAKT
jgi:hypothetical protein